MLQGRCFEILKIYNGYDETAPVLKDNFCEDSVEPLVSATNVVYIDSLYLRWAKIKFQLKWEEVERVRNGSETPDSCGDRTILLNQTFADRYDFEFTSPGYPDGYGNRKSCFWTIITDVSSHHPVVQFKKIDLEVSTNCVNDYVKISSDTSDGLWREVGKVCQQDDVKIYEGTTSLKVQFSSDVSRNKTGFKAITYLVCGGKMTKSNDLIDFGTSVTRFNPLAGDCTWNITVSRGKTIQFEFLSMELDMLKNDCESFVTIRNGVDDTSPYLGAGKYCEENWQVKIPPTSSNRAFVMFKLSNTPGLRFKLRYSEIQHECGGEIKLSSTLSSMIVASPNYPNIPPPHIECMWTIVAPANQNIRIDFLDRFDLTTSKSCDKEFVELRDGAISHFGRYCDSKPSTKYSRSNYLYIKYFTDISEPRNGFKANVSIGNCGGTFIGNFGYLTSPKYPAVGKYPKNSICEYFIKLQDNGEFKIDILDIDLPARNGTECDKSKDHLVISAFYPKINDTTSNEEIICGNEVKSLHIPSNQILVKFKTFTNQKDLFKGFKLRYNFTKINCGGSIEDKSGVIQSPSYPKSCKRIFTCLWMITVPKGRKVKVEFDDIDLINSHKQTIYVINGHDVFNPLTKIANSTIPDPIYSSDNKLTIYMEVSEASSNRGFRLKYSSDEPTICQGSLDDENGEISSPYLAFNNSKAGYICEYTREPEPILGNQGTIAYYFKDFTHSIPYTACVNPELSAIVVSRKSGETDNENILARFCGKSEEKARTVLSPFPDVQIRFYEVYFSKGMNFKMNYKTHDCGGIMENDGESYVKNPLLNATNDKILDCAWFVKFATDSSVSVTVKNLKLKLPCDQEFIKIYNGPTALSPTLGKFCGNEFNNDVINSEFNSIFIEYHTDNFIEHSKNSVFEIKLESTSFSCGGILTTRTRNFTTPNYGKSYPSNTECIWEIRSNPGTHVGLNFDGRFFIEDSVNCTKDYVEVFDFFDEAWNSLGKRCGRNNPQPFNSTSDKMKVIFRSDATSNGDGFKVSWDENCGGTFSVDEKNRFLTSPGYGTRNSYANHLNCTYKFIAKTKGSYINLKFNDFFLEQSENCMYDNVTIYKGSEKFGTFCGEKSPGYLRTDRNITMMFKTDEMIHRKGFEIEYHIDNCGGNITSSQMIQSPKIAQDRSGQMNLQCVWRIEAPEGLKIVMKLENLTIPGECIFNSLRIFNSSIQDSKALLMKVCSEMPKTFDPISINSNEALVVFGIYWPSYQTFAFSASIVFMPICDEKIFLTIDEPTFDLVRSDMLHNESLECVFNIAADPLSTIRVKFTNMHLDRCQGDENTTKCECNYLEILDGNNPLSESIGRFCGQELPHEITSAYSSLYIRFSTTTINNDTGFAVKLSMVESPCGNNLYMRFNGNESDPDYVSYPLSPELSKVQNEIRCVWTAEAQYDKMFEITFNKFNLSESESCQVESLTIEDNSVKEFIPEGLGVGIVYKSNSIQTFNSFGLGPTSPHVYCGSSLPHHYVSQTNKIRIKFKSKSKEISNFNFTIKMLKGCARNYTELQGRIFFKNDVDENCKTTIKVPENYTISLYFRRFIFYLNNCEKSFLKIYDGDFENGNLLKTLCRGTLPDPIFSTQNQLSLIFHQTYDPRFGWNGEFDIMYVASDKGRGCGGEMYNYAGIFTSPLYPFSNRTINDCTWTVQVPQNLKVGLSFESKLRNVLTKM